MHEKLGSFILLMCLVRNAASGTESCHVGNSYYYTGVKTPYDKIYNGTEDHVDLSDCKPLQIWLLCRHGTRLPKRDRISQMLNMTRFRDLIVDNHETGNRGHLCDEELKALKDWRSNPELRLKKGKHLSLQGRKDLSSIGKRLRMRFPELFLQDAPENYKFRSTNTPRTISSMQYFIEGSFPNTFPIKTEVVPETSDTLLKIYENCEPWKKGRFGKEVTAFINGPQVAKVVADVTQRLGFVNNISKDDAFLLYDMCRFERAWSPNKESPWCAAFSNEDMHIFEYEEDLYHYYSVGPGREINSKLGCQPVRDMLDRFTRLENAQNEPRGVFYFTHSEMIMLFYSAMGIVKQPVHLNASNYLQMHDRNWRTSLLVPFATNVAAVFYSCESGDSPFKVAFYVAEKPLTLDGCSNGICDWALLKRKLEAVIANCSADICREIS